MKKITLIAFLFFATNLIYSQESIAASGGEATGSGGTSSYSVGQTFYKTNIGSNAANHDVNGAKFKDWRLPTKRELNLMYQIVVNGNEPNFNTTFYWSSTQIDWSSAWSQYFGDGTQYNCAIVSHKRVRVVRTF